MSRIYTFLSTLLFMAMGLTAVGCGEGEEQGENPDLPKLDANRTVLVYIAGQNSLDDPTNDFVDADLKEMEEGFSKFVGDNLNLLVFVDRKKGFRDDPNIFAPCLLKIENLNGKVFHRVVKTYDDNFNSCGLQETKQVFADVFDSYQADSYGLVYWSHGEGWIPANTPNTRWVGQDEGSGTCMDIEQLAAVLADSPHLDFILFDACLMQSVEVAYELRHYTDCLIASPAEIPGPGSPYQDIVLSMFADDAALSVAKAYFNHYEDRYSGTMGSNDNWTMGTSIAVVSTHELSNLAEVTRKVLEPLGEVDYSALRTNASLLDYDRRFDSIYSNQHIGYYDMQGMMEEILPSDDFSEWKQAFDAALVYWNTTPKNYSFFSGLFSMEGANGISCYIPQNTTGAAASSYHRTAWYRDAGFEALGW